MKRKLETEIKVSGEAEYNQAIGRINRELKTLGAELKYTSAAYEENADSVEASSKKSDVLNRTLDTQRQKVDILRKAVEESTQKYGENDRRTQRYKENLYKAETQLVKTERSLKTNSAAIKENASSMQSLGSVVDNVANKLGISLPNGVSKTLDGLGAISPKAAAASAAIAALVAVIVKAEKKLKEMTLESASAVDDIVTMSAQTGIAVEQLQEFAYASELVDVSLGTIQSSMARNIRSMNDARKGTGKAVDAYKTLGISIQDVNGNLRDSREVFSEVIDALGKVGDTTERDALSMDIFGRSAQDLNPLIIAGSDSLRKYTEEAHQMGYVLSNEEVAALGAVDDAQQRLKRTQEAVTNQISAEYAPYMEQALSMTRDMTLEVGAAFQKSGVADSLGSILVSVTGLIQPLTQLGTSTLPVIGTALNAVAGVLAWITDALNAGAALLTFNVDKWNTALGLNPNQASNLQRWQFGPDYKNTDTAGSYGNYYNEATGMWEGNGARPAEYVDPKDMWVGSFNASGTDNFRGGFTWVGEAGPERVFLPRGSQIQTAQESRKGGDTFNFYVNAENIKELNDLLRVIESARLIARMKGK